MKKNIKKFTVEKSNIPAKSTNAFTKKKWSFSLKIKVKITIINIPKNIGQTCVIDSPDFFL